MLWAGLALGGAGGCGDGAANEAGRPSDSAPARENPDRDHPPASRAPWFEAVDAGRGPTFTHRSARRDDYFMPATIGSGAALFDFDNDGRLDVFLLQNAGPSSPHTHQLFHQRADGSFEDVTAASGLDRAGYGMGVAAGDVNNDGFVDLFVTEYGATHLFLNDAGSGRFRDATRRAGVADEQWGTSTCFIDYDRDGWLDLVVVSYVLYDPQRWCADERSQREFCGPSAFSGTVTRLYRNLGAQPNGEVTFEDVSVTSGIAARPGPGLGVFCADFNGDRWPDIFVANDGKPNHLWVNNRDGTFSDEAGMRGVSVNTMGKAEADMGVAVGDVDGDGLFDLFVTHLADETHTLWVQNPRGVFRDRTAKFGFAAFDARSEGFGAAMLDADHDGWLDLVLVNGRVRRAPDDGHRDVPGLDAFWWPYAQRNRVFANAGGQRLVDLTDANPDLGGSPAVSRGLACGDIDNDGDIDLLITRIDQPVQLLRNVAPKRGNWLTVRAVDPALNRDACGAEVAVKAGGRTWMRWVNPGYSYVCSNDPRAHFGLGGVEKFDAVQVTWPDGARESFPGGAVNRFITLQRGGGAILTD